MGNKVELTYRVLMDEDKLNDYVRVLYQPPEDPVPGEPSPGLHAVYDWKEEADHAIRQGFSPDTIHWTGPYVDGIEIEVCQRIRRE